MALDARAIALQGVGFGALLTALQGFAPTTTPPVLPPELPAYSLPARHPRDVLRVEGKTTLPTQVAQVDVADLGATAASRVALVQQVTGLQTHAPAPRAAGRLGVVQVVLEQTHNTPTFSGRHDIADEDLIAALVHANFFEV
jgi:hypothetical protein